MGRKKNTETVAIDGEKLRSLIKESEISAAELGRNAGYGNSYVMNAIMHNSISKVVVNFLELHGIHYEDYAPEVKEKETEQCEDKRVTNSIATLSPDELSQLIYQAVYSAVIHAWKEV